MSKEANKFLLEAINKSKGSINIAQVMEDYKNKKCLEAYASGMKDGAKLKDK